MSNWWSLFDRLTRTSSYTIGNHRLILNGRYTIGPNFHFAILMLIFLAAIAYLILSSVVSGSIVLVLIFLVLFQFEVILFASTVLTEPGIVPKGEVVGGGAELAAIVNGVTIERKWCYTCSVHRPPRGKHCVVCQCCVDRHDHHCKFLSNCIGLRNYRFFILFIFNSCLLAGFVLTVLLLPGTPSMDAVLYWMLIGASSLTVLLTGNLLVYHGKLILSGSTSYEDFKGVVDEGSRQNPFSLGSWQVNLNAFLTMPVDESKVAVRAVPVPGMLRGRPTLARDEETIELTTAQ